MKHLFTAALLAAATLCSCSTGVTEAPQQKHVAIQLWSVRDLINGVNTDGEAAPQYLEVLSALDSMGYTAIEAAGYGDGKFYGRTPADFKADVEGAGMKVLSSHTARPLSPEELASGDFTEAMKWWDEAIPAHKEAGMSYVVWPWLGEFASEADLDTYCRYFNEIGSRCSEAGLKFGYHNHAQEFKMINDSTRVLDYMLAHTNPDNVFFQMDVYWAVRGGVAPVDYFHNYPGRFKMLHIKDERELGQSGMVGFDVIFRNVDEAGTEAIVAEIERYSMPVLESVAQSLQYLHDSPFVPDIDPDAK